MSDLRKRHEELENTVSLFSIFLAHGQKKCPWGKECWVVVFDSGTAVEIDSLDALEFDGNFEVFEFPNQHPNRHAVTREDIIASRKLAWDSVCNTGGDNGHATKIAIRHLLSSGYPNIKNFRNEFDPRNLFQGSDLDQESLMQVHHPQDWNSKQKLSNLVISCNKDHAITDAVWRREIDYAVPSVAAIFAPGKTVPEWLL